MALAEKLWAHFKKLLMVDWNLCTRREVAVKNCLMGGTSLSRVDFNTCKHGKSLRVAFVIPSGVKSISTTTIFGAKKISDDMSIIDATSPKI